MGTTQFASEPTCEAVLAEVDGVLKEEEMRPLEAGGPFCDALPCPPPPPPPKIRVLTLEGWDVHRLLARREDALWRTQAGDVR